MFSTKQWSTEGALLERGMLQLLRDIYLEIQIQKNVNNYYKVKMNCGYQSRNGIYPKFTPELFDNLNEWIGNHPQVLN